ncbi:unnamed protein product [Caenorhabditis auriculariae]|uniref:Major facilitator superfamily (MFS) profile domain-containing protein n=1 Tax=Caenorhabditis auriculariae TaxID=2777116 RepID=A0A8S1HJH3_9PELO|nr:unnamed protein product [Caenorhabditis auriculariae]
MRRWKKSDERTPLMMDSDQDGEAAVMRSPFSTRKSSSPVTSPLSAMTSSASSSSTVPLDRVTIAMNGDAHETVPLYTGDDAPVATEAVSRCETSLSRKFSTAWRRVRNMYRRKVRILIFIITWLQLGSVMNCVDVFSFTMVYMEKNATEAKPEMYIYSMEEKSSLISAMAIGSLIGMYPQNKLLQLYGARPVLSIAGVLCAITTAFLPWALDKSYYAAFVFRVIQGVLYSADFGVVGYVCAKWSPLNEVGLSLAALSGFTACRAVIQLPLAGWIVSSDGWRGIYYVLSLILLAVTLLWYILYRDQPENYKLVTSEELAVIQQGKRNEPRKTSVPFRKIFADRYVWAVWFAGFADIFASFVFLVFGAQYYHYLGLDVQANAWLNSVKGVLFLVVRFLVGLGSDKISFLKENTKLRLCNTIALQLPAVFLIILGFLPRHIPYLHVLSITIFQALFGFNCGGFYKGGALISRQFSYMVIGQVQLFKSLAVLIEPLIFSLMVASAKDDESTHWAAYFAVHAVVLTIANTIYLFLARSEPCDFVRVVNEENLAVQAEMNASPAAS